MNSTEFDVDVAVVGAGPTGLALACELRLAGVTCRVLERRADEPNITRAFAVHARTLELLDARDMADQLVSQGIVVQEVQPAPGSFLDLRPLATRYPMVLIIAQSGTERMLEQRAKELGAEIVRDAEVVGLRQDGAGVTLDIEGGRSVRARYVVGTDGAHSKVRDLIGVDFVGKQYETHIILADVMLSRPPQETLFGATGPKGLVLFVPFGDGWFRAIIWDRQREDVPLDEPVTLTELQESFRRIAGDDCGMQEPRWRTRFLSEHRQARHYGVGRVFLAGDAAHVHSPVGGQGMNTGIGDAFNLGWKLAKAVREGDQSVLDSYETERHPVGRSVLQLTDALFRLVLSRSELGVKARQAVIRVALKLGPVRRRLRERLSGIGIRYDRPPGAHPWVGRRMPDLSTSEGRLYEVMREGGEWLVCKEGYEDP
ncbi:MAG TPA: FAD-dependent monooxygenase, partial [Candidatus Limnocylindrales bacterium]|nr:FAD-dependent monooxygenase [Candidatus Limnocylindrales bacterium]